MEILDKLNKKEWLSDPTPKPLTISFPSSEEVRMIGRRRKLTDEEKRRHQESLATRKKIAKSQKTSTERMGKTRYNQVGLRAGINKPTPKKMPTLLAEGVPSASYQNQLQSSFSTSHPVLLDGEMSSAQRILVCVHHPLAACF